MRELLEKFFSVYQRGLDFFYANLESTVPGMGSRHYPLEWNTDNILSHVETSGLFLAIYQHSNIKSAPQICGNFNFLFIESTNSGYQIFGASHNGYHYAIDKRNGEVAIIEAGTGIFFFNVACNEAAFLQVLIKMVEFSTFYIKKIEVTGELTRKVRKECIQLAGGTRYAKLYNFIIISEYDQPDEEFLLL